ncbi:MAG: LuxR C-terminal-related transcriptional regulator [Turicibacter sanguinis]|uniref:LuxR C-terminal-related transcriptional regulator n=1 Tax=Turicibacter sanguinis TaxID=154288 RepID=UPI00399296FF
MFKWIDKIKQLFNKQKTTINNSNSDILYIDLGASSIKMSYKGKFITFRSSVRVASDEEVTFQDNKILVDGKWYIIGESSQPTGTYQYKYMKENLHVLVLYGLRLLEFEQDEAQLHVLLPYNELGTTQEVKRKLGGVYQLHDTKVKLQVAKVYVEGESSKHYISQKLKLKGKNVCVVNIGYSTTDIALFSSQGYREKMVSLSMGTNAILSEVAGYTQAPTSSILNSWLVDGYKFTKDEQSHVSGVTSRFLSMIKSDLESTVFKVANPQNLVIVWCGGGSQLVQGEIDKVFKGYSCKVLDVEDSIYTDLKGMIELHKSVTDEERPLTKEEREQKIIELKMEGHKNSEIAKKLGCSESTVNNFMTRYNKRVA